VQLGR